MFYTFLKKSWPMAKYQNKPVIIITKEDDNSFIIDEHGDYLTVETSLLKDITKDEVMKKVNSSSLFKDICYEEGVIDMKEESDSYTDYIINN